jgi:hypothetical protein
MQKLKEFPHPHNILPNKLFEKDLLGRNQLVEKLANTIAINSSSIEKLILFGNACSDDLDSQEIESLIIHGCIRERERNLHA